MSYADAAARGPKQSAEEKAYTRHSRAPAPPQILQQDLETRSTVDVDSPHVTSVPSTYSGETDTQMERMQREADQAASAEKAHAESAKNKASHEARKAKDVAKAKSKEAKESAKKAGHSLQENSDNPVVVGNIVVWTTIGAVLGFGAYKQHQAGTLDWKVAGTWAGAVGVFAAGDYYLSQYLFQNKYPRK